MLTNLLSETQNDDKLTLNNAILVFLTKLSHLSNLYSIHIVLQFCAVLAMTFNSSQAMSLFTHGVPWSVTHALFLEYDIDQHVRRVNNDSINRSID